MNSLIVNLHDLKAATYKDLKLNPQCGLLRSELVRYLWNIGL